MSDMGLATARLVAQDVYKAECPTTHEEFVTGNVRKHAIGAQPVVWLLCACCDALMHTGDDCDPCEPQYHLYFDGGR